MTGCLRAEGQTDLQVQGLMAAGREVWHRRQLKLPMTAAVHAHLCLQQAISP